MRTFIFFYDFIFKTPVTLDLIGLQILTSHSAAGPSVASDFNLNLQRVSVPQETCASLQAIANISKLQHYFISVPKGTQERDHQAREDKRRGLKIFIAGTLILFYLFLLSECQARRGEKLICAAGRLENVSWKTGAREHMQGRTRWHGARSTQTCKAAGSIPTQANTMSHTRAAIHQHAALPKFPLCSGVLYFASSYYSFQETEKNHTALISLTRHFPRSALAD